MIDLAGEAKPPSMQLQSAAKRGYWIFPMDPDPVFVRAFSDTIHNKAAILNCPN